MTSYQLDVTKGRVGIKCMQSALASQCKLAPAHYWTKNDLTGLVPRNGRIPCI